MTLRSSSPTTASGFRAIPPLCPHMEEPLEESGIIANCALTCTKHLWSWDLQLARPARRDRAAAADLRESSWRTATSSHSSTRNSSTNSKTRTTCRTTISSARPERCARNSNRREPSMKITVETNSRRFRFRMRGADKLLYAGLAHGLTLPYECATGTCGTCRGRIMQGTAHVDWDQAPGFARLKRDKGDVLMCQARPTSDCVVRVPAKVVARPACDTLPRHRTARIDALRELTRDVLHFELALSRPMHVRGRPVRRARSPRHQRRARLFDGQLRPRRRSARLRDQAEARRRVLATGCSGAMRRAARSTSSVRLAARRFIPRKARTSCALPAAPASPECSRSSSAPPGEGYFRDHTGHVFFGVRTLEDGFYLSELCDYAAQTEGRLEVTLALSHEQAPAAVHPKFPRIRLMHGMVADAARAGDERAVTTTWSASSPARRSWWTVRSAC